MYRDRSSEACLIVYVVVSYTRANGHVIRPGLSLVQAYHLLQRLGHGAIFRAEGMSVYARPVYPWLPQGGRLKPGAQGRVA
jgi:hypothetical protein